MKNALCCLLACAVWAHAKTDVRIRITPEQLAPPISDDFLGFGYETSAVAQAGYFSSHDAALVRLYRNLSLHGLVRIGGNVSDHTHYRAEGLSVANPETRQTWINRSDLEDLGGFLRATGWQAMWGLNLGSGSKEEAVEEALAVAAALGDRLQSFEIGNEVDLQRRFGGDYDKYYAPFLEYKAAIRSALPQARFSGPDSAKNVEWCARFASQQGREVALLTQHYYRSGAGRPDATIPVLLAPNPAWDAKLESLEEICDRQHVRFRINEVNSLSGGGKAGVSDTFGSALWCLDYLFGVAAAGGEGVNLETDVNQLGWVSHYSPIFRQADGRLVARPEYYAMLAFAWCGHGPLLKCEVSGANPAIHVYATRPDPQTLWVVLINKDASRGAEVTLSVAERSSSARVLRLVAPTLESKANVTLGGASIAPDGSWRGGAGELLPRAQNGCSLALPAGSAALVALQ